MNFIKKLTLILTGAVMLLAFQNCGNSSQGPAGSPGSSCSSVDVTGGVEIRCTDGSVTFLADGEPGEDYVPFVASSFVGTYALENNSTLELLDAGNGRIAIGASDLNTVNFDGGMANHPQLPIGPFYVTNEELVGLYTPQYNRNTNDVEHDNEQSTNIDRRQDTLFNIFFGNDGKLRVRLIVYVRGEAVVDRTLKEL